jgi:hypothetical protein
MTCPSDAHPAKVNFFLPFAVRTKEKDTVKTSIKEEKEEKKEKRTNT